MNEYMTVLEAFEECPELTVVVPKDSYAEEYVKKNNIPYEIK